MSARQFQRCVQGTEFGKGQRCQEPLIEICYRFLTPLALPHTRVPALSVSAQLSGAGLPLGVQLLGRMDRIWRSCQRVPWRSQQSDSMPDPGRMCRGFQTTDRNLLFSTRPSEYQGRMAN